MTTKKGDIHDVIIIGGGIASHTAALYLARGNVKPLVLSGIEPDQLSTTTVVENYPGFPEGVVGPELIESCKKQAQKFGAEYIGVRVDSFKKIKDGFEIGAKEQKFLAKSVIIATGASPRTLGIKGEKEYWAKGVSTCATCDAYFYKNKVVAVIGGGDSAMEETLTLSKFAKKIYLIHRKDAFRASKIMQDRVMKMKDKVDIIWNTGVNAVVGDKFVTGLQIKDLMTNKTSDLKVDGMFLAIGHIPNTQIFQGAITLDEEGYIITDKRCRTNVAGVFAAGDCQDRIYRQAITSAGTGCQAALEAERYIESLKD